MPDRIAAWIFLIYGVSFSFVAVSAFIDPRSLHLSALTAAVFGVPGLLLGIFCLFITQWAYRETRESRIWVCSSGLLYLGRRRTPEPLPWSGMQLWRLLYDGDGGLALSGYRLASDRSNAEITFGPDVYKRVGAPQGQFVSLGHTIEQELVVHRLPELQLRVEAGGSVPFGPIEVGPSVLRYGAETLGWSQFSRVNLTDTMLTISRYPADVAWYQDKASAVPNCALLVGLVTAVAQSRKP